ncbi:MAG TPA: ADP-ribosylglycohydrolase family protein, partial [Desulfobacterales bacterium]|nr:ADP-ribosylglycohydrolase family protein [Desulfobacterales bacterium]
NRFTDDTVMTLAIAGALLDEAPCQGWLHDLGRRYPEAGYGGAFRRWLAADDPRPYHSYGNGSAMRVGAVPWFFEEEAEVLREARRSAEPTHDHPEGIKGAQATALAIRMALDGRGKPEIRRRLGERFGYDLSDSYEGIRAHYGFDVTCQGTVPPAIVAFLESHDYEDAVRKAVWLGGDSDTLACITGSIAEAFYGGVPLPVVREVVKRLPMDLLVILQRAVERRGRDGERKHLLPLVALREHLAACRDPLVVPMRVNQDCLAVRASGTGGVLDEAAWNATIRAAGGLRHGLLVVDFAGRSFGAADARIADLFAEAARHGRLVIANAPSRLASVLKARVAGEVLVYQGFEHAIRFAEMSAARAGHR